MQARGGHLGYRAILNKAESEAQLADRSLAAADAAASNRPVRADTPDRGRRGKG